MTKEEQMKRFLLPLLAAISLPTAVNANETNGKLLEYEKLIEEGYEILDDLVLRDQKNPSYEEYMEEFHLALEKCNNAIAMFPEKKEGYVCRGLMIGFYKKGSGKLRYQKKGLKDFSKAIKIDPEYLEAYYFRGILGFSMERISGSSIDGRACRDIKKSYKNNFPEAIEYVNRNKTFLKEDKCFGF